MGALWYDVDLGLLELSRGLVRGRAARCPADRAELLEQIQGKRAASPELAHGLAHGPGVSQGFLRIVLRDGSSGSSFPGLNLEDLALSAAWKPRFREESTASRVVRAREEHSLDRTTWLRSTLVQRARVALARPISVNVGRPVDEGPGQLLRFGRVAGPAPSTFSHRCSSLSPSASRLSQSSSSPASSGRLAAAWRTSSLASRSRRRSSGFRYSSEEEILQM